MFGLPEHFFSDVLAVLIFGFTGVLVVTTGTLLFDWGWRKVELQKEVKNGNISAGIVIGSVVIGLSILMSFTVKSITGN